MKTKGVLNLAQAQGITRHQRRLLANRLREKISALLIGIFIGFCVAWLLLAHISGG